MSMPPAFCEQHGEVEPCQTCKEEKEAQPPRFPALITEREMMILIRGALLGIVDAIERRYAIKKNGRLIE
jgi:hypothetical protein